MKTKLALLQDNYPKAMQEYEQALQIYPGDKMLGLDYAEKLLQNNNAQKAKTVLLGISSSSNPYYYRLLARAYQGTGAKAEAHFTLAENYYLTGQTSLAIEQLKQARQNVKQDFYLASRIDVRLWKLQEELHEEQLSNR